jgi:hypothetical protein
VFKVRIQGFQGSHFSVWRQGQNRVGYYGYIREGAVERNLAF